MSVVWRFFCKCLNDISKAQCSICNKKMTRGGSNSREFSTTNLINHLKRNHCKSNCSKIFILDVFMFQ